MLGSVPFNMQKPMRRKYYSSRNKANPISLDDLYKKLDHLFQLFSMKDYFKQKAGITAHDTPDSIKHEASLVLRFQPFPIAKWEGRQVTEDNIFDTIEFLFDYISKPGELVDMTTDSGWNYSDYTSYDEEAGEAEFRQKVNSFLGDYKGGFELSSEGFILAQGHGSLSHILDADIIPYDEEHVDSKVRHAIRKWRNRQLSSTEQKEAIREMADVFEWLKKTKRLADVLDSKDESALFDIANNFAVRHHNPQQKSNYDKAIWFSWIFHFYLATYHASIRLLKKRDDHRSKR
jgi:hypothetical protein